MLLTWVPHRFKIFLAQSEGATVLSANKSAESSIVTKPCNCRLWTLCELQNVSLHTQLCIHLYLECLKLTLGNPEKQSGGRHFFRGERKGPRLRRSHQSLMKKCGSKRSPIPALSQAGRKKYNHCRDRRMTY